MKRSLLAALVASSVLIAVPVSAQAPAPAPAPAAPLASGPVATAVPESQLKLAREIVEITGISRSFDGVMPDIALRIRQNFINTRPEIAKDMDDTLVALLPEIRGRRTEMIERAARSAGVLFTEAEMKEIITFFNSASGKKYVAVQPTFLNEIFADMEPWMKQTSEFFLSRFREEMRKKGHTV